MPSINHVIIASAGSGKTTRIVRQALSRPDRKSVIVTYTINNVGEIKAKFYEINGSIPSNITIYSWFAFLLHECVRPYQNYFYDKYRIESISFVNARSAKGIRKDQIETYFLNGRNIYTDKISEFALICNDKSAGLVLKRLEDRFDDLYIDEVQDLAGYDLNLIELLLDSNINIFLVGDNRQATYSTNNSPKNSKYRGDKIHLLFEIWKNNGRCEIEYLSQSFRCNQVICDLADTLFPEMPRTTSANSKITGHDGVFVVPINRVSEYISTFSPKLLRYDRRTDCMGFRAYNFGETKGLTFPRVLIFPNGPINKYLSSGNIRPVINSREKLYVGITRAEFSVAFVYSGNVGIVKLSSWPTSASQPASNS